MQCISERRKGLRGVAEDLDATEEGIGLGGERGEELCLPPALHALRPHRPRGGRGSHQVVIMRKKSC